MWFTSRSAPDRPTGAIVTTTAATSTTVGIDGSDLDERSRAILDFERGWWRFAGAKEQAIREQFDLSSTRYNQLLNALIDDDAALDHDPMLVRRLRRLRATRQRQRAERRTTADAS
jgi:hypothetical protein